MNLSRRLMNGLKNSLPMPFTIAVILTLTAILSVYILQPTAPEFLGDKLGLGEIILFWEKGFWELLAFTMQMVLILVLGHVLALSKPIDNLTNGLTKYGDTTAKAAMIVAFTTLIVAFFNWGLGLVFGAIIARKMGENAMAQGRKLNYPLIGAAGYSGFMFWHGGFSGSAPLTVAAENHFLSDKIGTIGAELTILSPMNITLFILVLFAIPGWFFWMGKKGKNEIELNLNTTNNSVEEKPETSAERLDHSKILGMLFGGLIIFLGIYKAITSEGGGLSFLQLNFINFLLLGLGIAFHGTFHKFIKATEAAIGGSVGIIIQFPLYAGIMGIMKYSGMIALVSEGFVAISTPETLPIFTFFSAGLVNIFVPSGGGQWVVQGPIVMTAALEIGSSVPKNIMALAYGDQITNMIQPFWALPLLGITGLKAKDLIPYTFVLMLIGSIIFIGGLLIF
jgi:short-chain fatty acids transporter